MSKIQTIVKMNAKLMSALVGIVVLATLCSAVPVEDNKGLDDFISQINGTTCLSNKANGGTYYGCVNVCVMKNGVKVCYTKCGYSAVAPVVEKPGHKYEEVETFLTEVNENTCFSADEKSAQNGLSYYDYCFDVCYNKNGVNVCYKKCGYSGNAQTVGTAYEAKCKQRVHCTYYPNNPKPVCYTTCE